MGQNLETMFQERTIVRRNSPARERRRRRQHLIVSFDVSATIIDREPHLMSSRRSQRPLRTLENFGAIFHDFLRFLDDVRVLRTKSAFWGAGRSECAQNRRGTRAQNWLKSGHFRTSCWRIFGGPEEHR